MIWAKRLLKLLAVIIVLLVLALAGLWIKLRAPRPEGGQSGEVADALAKQLEASIDPQAWARTGAITWTHAMRNTHLWDRKRGFDRVSFKDGTTVWIDLATQQGVVEKNGQPQEGAAKAQGLKDAYRWWVNDSFWLNPLVKTFDPGVTRKKVELKDDPDGKTGLLLQYSSGGVTPGDSYLWYAPESGPPRAWRMWVSVLPVGGLRVSWEDWTKLETGVQVATTHDLGGFKFRLTDLKAAEKVEDLADGTDPFARLTGAAPVATSTPSAQPASQPAPGDSR